MHLAEVELRKVARRTGRSAGAAAYAGLQFGHLADDLLALVEVVAVEVDGAGFVYGESEIYHRRNRIGGLLLLVLFVEPLPHSQGCHSTLVKRLADILRGGHSTGVEYTFDVALGVV